MYQFSSVQSLSHVRLLATPWTVACQASLSITNSQSLLKLMSIESVMPSNHLILCRPLLLPYICIKVGIYIYIIYIYAFHILFCYHLSQQIEYSSLCYTGPCCLSILYILIQYLASANPNSQSFPPPHPLPSGNYRSVLYVYDSVFVDRFICTVF